MDAALIAVKSDGSQNEVAFKSDGLVIGRDRGCSVRVPVPSVSRRHCKISAEDGTLVIRDLGSSNGTFVNRKQIEESELNAGDLISVGPVVFVVRLDGEPALVDGQSEYKAGAVPLRSKASSPSRSPSSKESSDDPFAAAASDIAPDDSSFADFDFDLDDEDDLPKL